MYKKRDIVKDLARFR